MASVASSSSDAMAGSPTINAAAGGAAGGIVLVALFPVDLAKTHMQANGTTTLQTARALFGSTDATFRRLYRGVIPALAEQAMNRSMLFGVGAAIKGATPSYWPEPMRDAASGAGAAFIKTSVLHPLDSVKCRWQLGLPLSELSGLYHGLSPALVRSSAGMAVWLMSRNFLERELPGETPWRHFLAGAGSSLITDLFTFPFDTLKKAMQASGGSSEKRTTLASHALRWRSEEGLTRFYRGYSARLVLVSVNGALFNSAFVAIKGWLT